MLWCTKLKVQTQRYLLATNEVLASWQYQEVYLIGLIALTFQIGLISRFLLDNNCDATCKAGLDAVFALLLRLGFVTEVDSEVRTRSSAVCAACGVCQRGCGVSQHPNLGSQ